jgi:hypothetical protein
MRAIVAAAVLLLAPAVVANADSFSVNITRGSIGQDLSNGVYAGTFSVTDTTTHQSFTAYCADLSDDVPFGQSPFTGTVTFGPMPNSVNTGPPKNLNIWASTPYPGSVGNRLDYILNQIMFPAEHAGLTNAQSAALQGAIWQVMGNYVTSNNLTDPLVKDVDNLVAGNAVTTSSWSFLNTLAAYSSSNTYGSPSEFLILPTANQSGQPLQYQVLIGVTPEPSTMLVAGLGAIGFIGYGVRRRKRA